MTYYEYIKKAFDKNSLQAPSEQSWMTRDDLTYFKARKNYKGMTAWGAPLILVAGEVYTSNGVATELLKQVEIIPSPYLTDAQKMAPLFDSLPAALKQRESELILQGIEAHVHGRRTGNLRGWSNGTQKLLEAFELIKERQARELAGNKSEKKSFFREIFS